MGVSKDEAIEAGDHGADDQMACSSGVIAANLSGGMTAGIIEGLYGVLGRHSMVQG